MPASGGGGAVSADDGDSSAAVVSLGAATSAGGEFVSQGSPAPAACVLTTPTCAGVGGDRGGGGGAAAAPSLNVGGGGGGGRSWEDELGAILSRVAAQEAAGRKKRKRGDGTGKGGDAPLEELVAAAGEEERMGVVPGSGTPGRPKKWVPKAHQRFISLEMFEKLSVKQRQALVFWMYSNGGDSCESQNGKWLKKMLVA